MSPAFRRRLRCAVASLLMIALVASAAVPSAAALGEPQTAACVGAPSPASVRACADASVLRQAPPGTPGACAAGMVCAYASVGSAPPCSVQGGGVDCNPPPFIVALCALGGPVTFGICLGVALVLLASSAS